MTITKNTLLVLACFISAALKLSAQDGASLVSGVNQAQWRRDVFTALPDALSAAAKGGRTVVVCFSSDPLGDDSIPARILGSKQIRAWAADRKLTFALVEFPKARTPGVQEARSRFVELTRLYKIAGSPAWLFLDSSGKELGRLNLDDVVLADSRGDFAAECDFDFWIKQAASILKVGRPEKSLDPVKEPAWYARFGGQGWTGKRTVSGEAGAMNYTLFVPLNLVKGQKYPLVIWLHGGVRSDGNEIADVDAVHLSAAAARPNGHYLLLIPSAIAGQNWFSAPAQGSLSDTSPLPSPTMKLISTLLDTLPHSYPIDSDKVVVMGESGGAYGCWALLEYFPNRFAGAVINSGGGDPKNVVQLASQRIWMIHGEKDARVPIQEGEQMFQALLQRRGGKSITETEGDWTKASDTSDTLRFWRDSQSGHVPAFDYSTAMDWVLLRSR
jgi:predicted esterase